MLATNRNLAAKIYELESRLDSSDLAIRDIFKAIKELVTPTDPKRTRIGFPLPAKKLR
jgi:hypothetical protein